VRPYDVVPFDTGEKTTKALGNGCPSSVIFPRTAARSLREPHPQKLAHAKNKISDALRTQTLDFDCRKDSGIQQRAARVAAMANRWWEGCLSFHLKRFDSTRNQEFCIGKCPFATLGSDNARGGVLRGHTAAIPSKHVRFLREPER
jgi:hypothetical protein